MLQNIFIRYGKDIEWSQWCQEHGEQRSICGWLSYKNIFEDSLFIREYLKVNLLISHTKINFNLWNLEMNNLKLKDAFDYFETIKNDLLVDAQITIRYISWF